MPYEATPKTYTITAALPYANGPIHIGHLAGVYIPADIYARYLRSRGHRVLFVSGSDEHGVPITIQAQQQKISPQVLVNKYHQLNQEALEALGISFDIFARTSSAQHHQTAAAFFSTLYEKGVLTAHETEQYYDDTYQQFLPDRYIRGICPKCTYAEAYGDQCEACGTALSPEELLTPRSILSDAQPVRKKTKHWYLALEAYTSWLKQWILVENTAWKPSVYSQCKAWLDQGLRPRAITRDLSWGVPVPLPDAEQKVLYVWFDAPIGYISATQTWAAERQVDWEPFWKDPATRLIHFVGKDNIVFHCIMFPTMLKAHGGFILPHNVPAHAFLNLQGDKISTSRNRAVWLHEYLTDFAGKQDVLRYVLCSNAPENKDSDFTWADFQAKNNHELVAIVGNFVHRTLVLVHKHFQGKVPERMHLTRLDQAILGKIKEIPGHIGEAIEQYRFRDALQHWVDLARLGNKYLSDTAPWHGVKVDIKSVQTVLNIALQIVGNMAVLGTPFLPFTSQRLRNMLGITDVAWPLQGVTEILRAGQQLQPPTLLFERIEDGVIQDQVERCA